MRLNVGFLSLLLLAACGGGGTAPEKQDSGGAAVVLGAPRGVLILGEQGGRYQLDAWFTRVPELVFAGHELWQEGDQTCHQAEEIGLSQLSSGTVTSTNVVQRAGSLWEQTLSAGSALEIRDRGGVVTRLPAQRLGKGVLYATEESWLDEALPEDAYLHIPGALDFPAYESISLAPLTPLILTTSTNGFLTDAQQTIDWQSSPAIDDVIELTLKVADGAGMATNTIVCDLDDSGSFLLPATIRKALGLPDSAGQIQAVMLRKRSVVHEVGESSLRITQLSRP